MKKILLTLFCLATVILQANAETYTHTFKSGELTTEGGTVTLSDIEWSASSSTYIGWSAEKGIQIGKKAAANPLYTLSTKAFAECTIRSITVNTSIAASGDAKMTISVGNQTSEAYTPTTSDAAYTFDCENTMGDITIKWEASQRAYYVKSITIEYTPAAGTVVVPTPEFKTPLAIYADKVQVTAETTDQTAVLYYTLDGTDPSYEDYINDAGTTKCSKYWVMYFDLTTTTTIKVMAVKTDGDAVFKSNIAEETYVVSPTMPYLPATSIVSGNKYSMVAADSAATCFYEKKSYGYLPTKTATDINGKYIETVECAGFTFTAVDGGYTIQDCDGNYMYHKGTYTNFNFAKDMPAEGAVWSVTIDGEGNASISCDGYTIHYSTEHKTFGCYTADKVTENHILPKLYVQREYPTYTVAPASGSSFDKLETITIVCEEGIAATSDLKITAEGLSTVFTVTQTDSKTLTVKAAEPITTHNNIELNMNISAGDIILCPGVMDMSIPVPAKYGVRTFVKYNIVGNAPAATITETNPADGSTVEELTSVVFTFSYYVNKTENEEILPRLYNEQTTAEIPVEYSTKHEDGVSTMYQAAIKATEPIRENGRYILEVPEGYFVDANGKNVAACALSFTVKNEDTGIEEVIAKENNGWTVYSAAGVKLFETTDAETVNNLPCGLYIINGEKVFVK